MRIFRYLLILPVCIAIAGIFQYFFSAKYKFGYKAPFSGENWYNPYAGNQINRKWVKANFHTHSRCWWGITNGIGEPEDIYKLYKQYGYGNVSVSNYHQTSTSDKLSAYEHGFNLLKTHQLVFGDPNISWGDYVFPQSLSNKQETIYGLKHDPDALVVLNHPKIREGYSVSDFSQLTGFDLIELLHPSGTATDYWDSALAVGNPVFSIGSDDLHDFRDLTKLGQNCTVLPDWAIRKEAILKALRTGNSYSMKMCLVPGETVQHRLLRLKNSYPVLESADLDDADYKVRFSETADSVLFISEGSQVRMQSANSAMAAYTLRAQDRYIRVEAFFPNGISIYLNPVFRYRSDPFEGRYRINPIAINKMISFHLLGSLLLLVLFFFIFKGVMKRIFHFLHTP